MCQGRQTRILVSFFAAAVAVVTAYLIDTQTASVRRRELAHSFARQVVAQAEGLAFSAREGGEADPMGVAAHFLGQGVEPRVMQVTKIVAPAAASTAVEKTEWNARQGSFEYSRLVVPEQGLGVRVRLGLGYRGFLDTSSRWKSDFAVLIFFVLAFALAFLAVEAKFRQAEFRSVEPEPNPFAGIQLQDWIAEARGTLAGLGTNFRDLLREAHRIILASNKSRESVGKMRERLHAELRAIRTARKQLADSTKAITTAETLLKRYGANPAAAGKLQEELLRLLAQIRETQAKNESTIRDLEIRLEPLTTDADIAFHAYGELSESKAGLQGCIDRAKTSVVAQARMVEKLSSTVSPSQKSLASA